METRVAAISIIIEDTSSVESLNAILHDYAQYVIGRMGVPYRECNINIIMVAVRAEQDVIAAMTGKIGALSGVNAKVAYSK